MAYAVKRYECGCLEVDRYDELFALYFCGGRFPSSHSSTGWVRHVNTWETYSDSGDYLTDRLDVGGRMRVRVYGYGWYIWQPLDVARSRAEDAGWWDDRKPRREI